MLHVCSHAPSVQAAVLPLIFQPLSQWPVDCQDTLVIQYNIIFHRNSIKYLNIKIQEGPAWACKRNFIFLFYTIISFPCLKISITSPPASLNPSQPPANLPLSAPFLLLFLPLEASTQEKYSPVVRWGTRLFQVSLFPLSIFLAAPMFLSIPNSFIYFAPNNKHTFKLIPSSAIFTSFTSHFSPHWAPKADYTLLVSSVLSSQGSRELREAENVQIAQGHPVRFYGRI